MSFMSISQLTKRSIQHAACFIALLMISLCVRAETASVYFIEPMDGQTLSSPVTVKFGLQGMGVAPAGVDRDNTGHHHLLIDVDTLPDLSKPLPASEQVRHFGGGQTEATIELAPGTHTLQLVLGDFAHRPHAKPVVSKKITITVK
jgi:Domain of unknown function (DUF4399)